MTADQVWNRHRAISDIGKFSAVWVPTDQVVRLHGIRPPEETIKLGLDEKYPNAKPGRYKTLTKIIIMLIPLN